jgi:hypothetical protein
VVLHVLGPVLHQRRHHGMHLRGRMRLRDEGEPGYDISIPIPDYYYDLGTNTLRAVLPEDVRGLWSPCSPEWNPRKVPQEMSELQSEVADDDTVRFTVTLRYTYEKSGADLQKYYDTRNLREAAEIDRKNFIDEPTFIAEDIDCNSRPFTVDVSVARITQ